MTINKITPEKLWSQQEISSEDVDYEAWEKKRVSLQEFSRFSPGCLFTVDVFKKRYDFASEHFAPIFGYAPSHLQTIRCQGDMLEDRIHPDDREQLLACQVEHGQFIYSLPPEERNDYQQVFQFRMLGARQQYMNVTSRQQVMEKDRQGKAWIIMGVMDLSPDQTPRKRISRTVINRKTGMIVAPTGIPPEKQLTAREKEILLLIRQGYLSKEIAYKLNISIHTVNNHRKNLLAKLDADNVIEALNAAEYRGIRLG